MPVYSHDNIYEIDKGLRDRRESFSRDVPFSRSYIRLPFKELFAAAKLLHDSLIHEREFSGITDEDLKFIRRLESKMKTLLEDDIKLRLQQDLVLRCLHPDGCYHAWVKPAEFNRAYEISGTDRLEGIAGIQMGWPRPEIHSLAEYLQTVVERIKRENPRMDCW